MENWKKSIDYPEWMTEEGIKTLVRQHLLEDETPKLMYQRIVDTLSDRLFIMLKSTKMNRGEIKKIVKHIKQKWFDYLWRGWLSPSTPILSNVGTTRGYGISCFIIDVDDTMDNIFQKNHEMALLTKMGGGVGVTFKNIRGRGEPISSGGFSEGTIPFMKVYDSTITASSQGSIRRGAASINLPIRHKDIDEFLNIRLPEGDVNRQCLNLNHCVTVDDIFMEKLVEGDFESRKIWAKILSTRMKSGQPYIMYYNNAKSQRPDDMKKRKLKIQGTNICTEIFLPHDPEHTVVCDLASLNIAKLDEWIDDYEFIELSLLFLDVNLEEFIANASGKVGFEKAVNFAKKSRSLGLGWLGWATYLQTKGIPFASIQSRGIINKIGAFMKSAGEEYQKKWSKILGSPEWCDTNRNLTLFAIAPTTTTSLVMGGVSQGIEPIISNVWVQKSAKGTFIRKNPQFENLIKQKYPLYDTNEFWMSLGTTYKGSIQHLDFLTNEEKEIFLTAYEINQLELVKQVGMIQKYIDQGISTNLFFPADVDPKWLNKVHIAAWQEGLKSLYYVRTESILSRNMTLNTFSDCLYCEG
jgi:ribonucleoside-diphosphate reductase alpha chain